MRRLIRTLGGLTAIGAGVLGWSLIEAQSYTLRRFDVPILPLGAEPIRLLHISDLHLLPSQRRRVEWVRSLADTDPDLVITTGDNFGHADALPAVMEAYAPFLHLPGAFVTGSNDYYLPVLKNPLRYLKRRQPHLPKTRAPNLPAAEFIEELSGHGWHNLDNARSQIQINGTTLDLVGTGDAHIKKDSYPEPAKTPPGDALIGVTHAPYAQVLEQMHNEGVRLALAGHTHGGQVCVPGVGALVTNCDLDRHLAKGLHPWRPSSTGATSAASMWLHVSAGLGTSPFTPVRLACRPEASLITLTAQ